MNCVVTLTILKPDGSPLEGVSISARVNNVSTTALTDSDGVATWSLASGSKVRFLSDSVAKLNGLSVSIPKTLTFSVGVFEADTISEADQGGIKRYVALLSQSGTDAPVATVLENTLGETLAWARTLGGRYTLTAASPIFTASKLVLRPVKGFAVLVPGADFAGVNISVLTTTVLQLETYFEGSPTDDVLDGFAIEITVYP